MASHHLTVCTVCSCTINHFIPSIFPAQARHSAMNSLSTVAIPARKTIRPIVRMTRARLAAVGCPYSTDGIDLLTETNALGVQVSSNTYNTAHQVLTNVNALGETTVYTYNANQHVTSITRPTGHITSPATPIKSATSPDTFTTPLAARPPKPTPTSKPRYSLTAPPATC